MRRPDKLPTLSGVSPNSGSYSRLYREYFPKPTGEDLEVSRAAIVTVFIEINLGCGSNVKSTEI
jgi:hypothetical protein